MSTPKCKKNQKKFFGVRFFLLYEKKAFYIDIQKKAVNIAREIKESKKDHLYMTKEELKQKQIQSGKDHYDNIKEYRLNCMDEKKALEIRQKGQKASIEAVKRKKGIKAICNDLLSLSAADMASGIISADLQQKIKDNNIDITLYDLIIAKQIENALATGSVKSAEFLRDSNGDKPTDKIQADVIAMSDGDRAIMEAINNRLNMLEGLHNNTIIDNDNND